MKNTLKSVKNRHFKIRASKSLAGKNGLWMDFYGDSFAHIAASPFQAKCAAKQLREAAEWVETVGAEHCAK